MLSRCRVFRQAVADDGSQNVIGKVEGYHLIGRIKTGLGTISKYRERHKVDGEEIVSRGIKLKKAAGDLQDAMKKMDNPMIWIWYPWRRTPEPPLPSFPCPNALKNLNGAVLTDLSAVQYKLREEMIYANPTESKYAAKMEARYPFLKQILEDRAGRRTAFPFFYKKYPTKRHALNARFGIPTEMLEGLPSELQRALSPQMMTEKEREARQVHLYTQRYAEHPLDENNPAVQCVKLAIKVREQRNHLMSNPNNNIVKLVLHKQEQTLRKWLRMLRKTNFRKYWEILRDHDLMEIMQPSNLVRYRWGNYWRYDWEKGTAITTNIGDFMDPRGLNGCIETGRSRAEVARDLGLSYTRPLNPKEKKLLSHNMLYWTKLQQFKIESPEEYKRRERMRFVAKFTSLHTRTKAQTASHDYPSHFRRLLGTKILRWKSKRHGPE